MKRIILMSIRPEWVAKILNKEKTVEIRKTALHEGDEVHIYCTKGKPYLYEYDGFHLTSTRSWSELHDNGDREWFYIEEVGELNGKVVAKFIVGKVEKIEWVPWESLDGLDGTYYIPDGHCLSDNDIIKYAPNGEALWAIEITQLEIFDKPRELGEYKKPVEDYSLGATGGFAKLVSITHAPQSYMHAWVEEVCGRRNKLT